MYNENKYGKKKWLKYNEPKYNEPKYNEPKYNEPKYNEPKYNNYNEIHNNEYRQYNNIYCNNCGNLGHLLIKCKFPIISYGIISYRINNEGLNEYLMMCRKHTLGYMDFIRGKTPINNRIYYINMFSQMTVNEKNELRLLCNMNSLEINNIANPMYSKSIKEKIIQLNDGVLYTSEIMYPSEINNETNAIFLQKMNSHKIDNNNNTKYTMKTLIDESDLYGQWIEPEWGFPKGRRNLTESDYVCATREFQEETGLELSLFENVRNIMPFEEMFYGSNNKLYKHKYFIMKATNYDHTITADYSNYQSSEVSKIQWLSYNDCLLKIRSYNTTKQKVITNIHNCVTSIHIHSIL